MSGRAVRTVLLRAAMLTWLTAVWVLLWGSASWANMLGGFGVAVLITVLLPLPRVAVEGQLHPLSLLRLVAVVAWYLVLSSLQVAWLTLRPGPPPRSAVLRARLDVRSDFVLALAVNICNLIPGSIILEIDQERRLIYAHVLDVGSDRAVARFYEQVRHIETLLHRTFDRPADRSVARPVDQGSEAAS